MIDVERGFYKRLADIVGVDAIKIALIRAIVEGTITFDETDKLPQTAAWLRSCHNRPSRRELVLSAIDEVIETHGVESIRLHRGGGAVHYCNSGDTYNTTVLYQGGKLRVGNWGYYVEKYGAD